MAEGYERKIPFKDIVFVSSPQYISVMHWGGGTVPLAKSLMCEVYVWNGLKSAVPATPQYTLNQKSKPTDLTPNVDESYATFEISSFIKEQFIIKFQHTETSTNNPAALWFRVRVIADSSQSNYTSATHLATLGWGDFTEGTNPGISQAEADTRVIGLTNNFAFSPLLPKLFPVYVGEGSTNESMNLAGGIDVTFTEVGNTHSAKQFKIYNSLDLLQDCGSGILELLHGVGTRNYNFKSVNVKNQNVEVVYYGKYGVQTTLTMLGRADVNENKKVSTYDNITIDLTPTFNSQDDMIVYNPLLPQKKTYLTQTRRTITINSGVVNESAVPMYLELFKSEHIWLRYEGQVLPVILVGKSFKTLSSVYDKIHEYSLVFQLANPEINQVV